MRVDERAWLVVTQKNKALVGIVPLPHGIVSVRNKGKTPARHVFGNFIIEIIKNGESPHFTPVKIPHSAFVFGTLSPQRQEEIPIECSRLKPEIVVPNLPSGGHLFGGGHWTRDLAFSKDGSRMFVSVGSLSNDATDGISLLSATPSASQQVVGALEGSEAERADVLQFDPEGKSFGIFATGLRNCVGMAMNQITGDLWCSTNERDGLGDNLPPDYITPVHAGNFFGWPWYYIGDNEDPYHKGERPISRTR